MGFFGNFRLEGGSWSSYEYEAELPTPAEPWLWVTVYDSDITTVSYGPPGPGTGVAYLGVTPRTYFESADASPPTDVAREAAGLAAWCAAGPGARRATVAEIAGFLAEDVAPEDVDLDEEIDIDELADEEVFVELKTARFLLALGLPLPEELAPMAQQH